MSIRIEMCERSLQLEVTSGWFELNEMTSKLPELPEIAISE